MKNYGKELILDIHECNTTHFNRRDLEDFFVSLCDLIDMKRAALHFWDYEDNPEDYEKAPPHLKGTSVVQFIMTSSIVVHTLDELKRVYINIFSCKDFNTIEAQDFCIEYFKGKLVHRMMVNRQ